MSDSSLDRRDRLAAAINDRQADLADYVLGRTESFVVDGPFVGMRLLEAASWGSGDVVPKSLGCYEQELHAPLATLLARAPDVVVNVGCAEGYYAVGLARLLPQARVHAFDIDAEAQRICGLAATVNGVGKRVGISGECTAADLGALAAAAARPLALLDCEGAEIDLIAAEILPSLARCDLLIECHDFVNPQITPTLIERLRPSHDLAIVEEAGRDPNRYEILRGLGSFDRWLAVCEFRPMTMHWLVATARR